MKMKTADVDSPSASQKPLDASRAETTEAAWKPLYRIGGAAALMVVLLYVIQIIVFVVSPPPSAVVGYFTLFHKNALLGLLDLDLLSLADYALFVPMFRHHAECCVRESKLAEKALEKIEYRHRPSL